MTWGLTDAFQDTGASLVGLAIPVVEMVGEKKKKVIMKTPNGPLLSLCHMYDADGNELVADKDHDMKYTVLLNKKKAMLNDERRKEAEMEAAGVTTRAQSQVPSQIQVPGTPSDMSSTNGDASTASSSEKKEKKEGDDEEVRKFN